MRRWMMVAAIAAVALALCLGVAAFAMDSHKKSEPLRNPYWPYSVEVSIRDL